MEDTSMQIRGRYLFNFTLVFPKGGFKQFESLSRSLGWDEGWLLPTAKRCGCDEFTAPWQRGMDQLFQLADEARGCEA